MYKFMRVDCIQLKFSIVSTVKKQGRHEELGQIRRNKVALNSETLGT